jgi:hypothetical protein
VHRQCRRSMNIHDNLTAVVRSAIHESDFYTEPEAARLLVKFYGPKAAARLILEGQQDVSLRCFLAYFFGLPSSHFTGMTKGQNTRGSAVGASSRCGSSRDTAEARSACGTKRTFARASLRSVSDPKPTFNDGV